MNVYQINVICSDCEAPNCLILTDRNKSAHCDHCGESLLTFRRFDGCVYVLKNSKVDGVKIGMTAGDVFSRAKQVSGTGVPGNFHVVAAFHSRNPRKDEKKVHLKLARHNIEKEHFSLDPVRAVVKMRTIFGRDWVYLNPKYRDDVANLVETQRAAAAARFSSSSKSNANRMRQQDLFEGEGPRNGENDEKLVKQSRGKVFSFLFD